MTSMADEGLLSPAYKLGKRALHAIENTHGHINGPSLKRPFAMPYFHGSSLSKATSMPMGRTDASSAFIRTMHHAVSMDASMPSVLSDSWASDEPAGGVVSDMAPPCNKVGLLHMPVGKDAATMLQEMHEETTKIAVCCSSIKRSRQCDDAAVTPRVGREQLLQQLGNLAIQHDKQAPCYNKLDQDTPRYEHPPQKHAAFIHDGAHASPPRWHGDAATGMFSHMSPGTTTSHIHSMVEGTPVHGFGASSVEGSPTSAICSDMPCPLKAEPVEGVPVMGAGPTWQQYHAVVREMRAERDKARNLSRKQKQLQQEQDQELATLQQQMMLLARGKRDAMSSLESVSAEREALRKALEATARQLDSSHAETGLLTDKVTLLEAMLESQQDEHDQMNRQLEVAYASEARNKQVIHVLELRCSQLKLHLRNQHGMVAHLVEQMSAPGGEGEGSGCEASQRDSDDTMPGTVTEWPDMLEPDADTD